MHHPALAFPPGLRCLASLGGFVLVLAGLSIPLSAQIQPPFLPAGTNDFRISHMGPDGDSDYGAMWFLVHLPMAPKIAYNSADDEYLVVWWADDDSGGLADGEFEIWGQRIDASTGSLLGSRIRISFMGPDGDPDYDALFPAVTYNPVDNEYMVVWTGDHDDTLHGNDDFEVFGRVVDSDGSLLGLQFSFSAVPPYGNPSYGVPWWIPAVDVAHDGDPTHDYYFVTWVADPAEAPLVDDEFEIFMLRVRGTGQFLDGWPVRLSAMGPDGNPAYLASEPSVAWDSTHDNFLVVWHGDHHAGSLADDEFEIWGQIFPADPAAPGWVLNNVRLSTMGTDGVVAYGAFSPSVVYNDVDDDWFVVWHGDDDSGSLTDDEYEVWGRKLDWNLTPLDTQLRLSAMGFLDGVGTYDALVPEVAFDPDEDQYVVVWAADDDTFGMVDEEFEVFGQFVSGPSGVFDVLAHHRLSDLGPNGDIAYDALTPDVAYAGASHGALVAWWGDDDCPTCVGDEFEIWGQRLQLSVIFADGFESGDFTAWTASVP